MFIQISHIVSPSLALSILTSHASQLVGPYLEACLENGSAIHKEFDHELANVYLKTALEKEGADSDGQSQTFLGEDEALQKLKNLVGHLFISGHINLCIKEKLHKWKTKKEFQMGLVYTKLHVYSAEIAEF